MLHTFSRLDFNRLDYRGQPYLLSGDHPYYISTCHYITTCPVPSGDCSVNIRRQPCRLWAPKVSTYDVIREQQATPQQQRVLYPQACQRVTRITQIAASVARCLLYY